MSDRCFQGICPLVVETEELPTWIVAQGKLLIEMFNDHLELDILGRQASGKRKPPLPKPLDLAGLN